MPVYKTEIKSTGNDIFFSVPASFVEPLKWCEGDTVDIELVGNVLQISKI